MHEFSLAVNILDLCTDSLKEYNAQKVTELILEVGTFAGVEMNALETAIETLKPKSILELAEIKFIVCRARATCTQCQSTFEPADQYSPCPECHTYGMKIITGDELLIKSITLE